MANHSSWKCFLLAAELIDFAPTPATPVPLSKSLVCVGKVWMDCCCTKIPEGNDLGYIMAGVFTTSADIKHPREFSRQQRHWGYVFLLFLPEYITFPLLFLFVITSVHFLFSSPPTLSQTFL
ncbi:hypothetical protein NPIL_486451 [Nephila pilipes]|uniref:Uncharacterized protein n=1 Tax=Nephila pilipes TaxID=299642 RepID=A0A8X6QAH1_NEPPI|nr:hypothetical protein NPIL_486451 [Nephila pilipes]